MLRYNKLKELNICDAYLITSDVNRYYFSGFKASYGYVICTRSKNYFLTDNRYYEEASAYFNGVDVEVIAGTQRKIYSTIQSIVLDESIKTIGFEDNKITYEHYNHLKELLNKEFVPLGKRFDRLRAIKDEYELKQIETAQKITDRAFSKVLDIIKPNMTEMDVKAELEYLMLTNGADGPAFDTIIASGSNASRPHSSVSERKICLGDFIIMDFGAKFNGYCSDMTRTVAVGNPNPKMVDIYNAVLKTQKDAIIALNKTTDCAEMFLVSKEFLNEKCLGDFFLHGLGHGVGIEIHEAPTLNSISCEKLENNMVITIEPGVYIEKEFGVRIEDLIIFTENSIKNLTTSKKELIIL